MAMGRLGWGNAAGLEELIGEIRLAFAAGSYALALQGSLALIDICGAMEYENGVAKAARFKKWFSEHLGDSYDLLDAEDVYQLRCGMLHQGRTKSDKYEMVIFTLPSNRGSIRQALIDEVVLSVDLASFCENIITAVEKWWTACGEQEPVRSNADFVVRRHPHGIPPYIVGLPILA